MLATACRCTTPDTCQPTAAAKLVEWGGPAFSLGGPSPGTKYTVSSCNRGVGEGRHRTLLLTSSHQADERPKPGHGWALRGACPLKRSLPRRFARLLGHLHGGPGAYAGSSVVHGCPHSNPSRTLKIPHHAALCPARIPPPHSLPHSPPALPTLAGGPPMLDTHAQLWKPIRVHTRLARGPLHRHQQRAIPPRRTQCCCSLPYLFGPPPPGTSLRHAAPGAAGRRS